MNARFDDEFQLEMLRAAGGADTLIVFNRLWDSTKRVAYGGFDLSDRNLRALRAMREAGIRCPALVGTGNVCSGRLILDYALLGCESVELHTYFQLPLSEYSAEQGSRTQRALHSLIFHPSEGLIAGMLGLESEGLLERVDGELRFLDVVNTGAAAALKRFGTPQTPYS